LITRDTKFSQITYDSDWFSPDSNGKLCEGKNYFFLSKNCDHRSTFFGL